MGSAPNRKEVIDGALRALAARAGPLASERTLTVLIALPPSSGWRAGADGAVATAGGRVIVRGDVLVAFFTSVGHAVACARALQESATDRVGQVAAGVDHLNVPLDGAGNPVGPALADAATITGLARPGQVLFSDRALPHLTEARTTPVAKLPAGVGKPPQVVHEVAWHPRQPLGRSSNTALMVVAGLGALALGIFIVSRFIEANVDAEMERKMMVALPIARPDAGSAAKEDAEKPERTRPVRRTGTLTLLTTPSATVKLRGKPLGETPLFNAVLDVGTHVVELSGPDGKVRVLSVPIRNGENTAFRLRLEELPVR